MRLSFTAPARVSLLAVLCLSVAPVGTPVVAQASTPTMASAAATPALGDAGDLARPDSVSAMVTARAQDHRVEDLSQRTSTDVVYANPDGTWTADSSPEPVRMQDAKGEWHDIDTTLVPTDGGFAPRYADTDVVLSNGGDTVVAALTEDGKDLDWRWPTPLPEPVIDGDTATYRDVVPDGDLVVRALSTGFTHSIVLRQRPTAPVEYTMPVATDGARLVEETDGGLSVETKGGDELVSAPQPLMWDSSQSATGSEASASSPSTGSGGAQVEPEGTVPVETAVTETAAGTPSLTLSPDAEFLSDPSTVYPVTIDPSWTTGTTGDTYVMNTGMSGGDNDGSSLRVGTDDGGVHVRRAFLHFDSTKWNGKHVTSAKLVMRNWNSASCSGATIRVARLLAPFDQGITWGNQPGVTATNDADFFPAYGLEPGCPNADASWDVTGIVNGWAAGSFPNYGLRVKAVDETSNKGYRSYISLNAYGSEDSRRPKIVWTWNNPPATATTPSVAPSAAYAPSDGTTARYAASATPTFSAKASDPDGGTVSLRFEARTSASGTATLAASCTSSTVAQNSTESCHPSSGLAEGSTYYLRAKAFDGTDWAGTSQTAAAGWSPWTKFVVATTTPAKPTISCPGHADGSWTTGTPASDLSCTISAAAAGAAAPVRIHYSLNGAAEKIATITPSSDPAMAKTTVTVPKTAGGYHLTASAESPSGLASANQDYRFGYGQLGLAAPAPPAVDPLPITTGSLALDASGPPDTSTATAKVQWRLSASGNGAATGWNDATDATLTVANDATSGVRVTGTWDTTIATQDAFAGGTDGTDLDPRKPVRLDIQVCVTYPSGDQCTWSTNPRTIMRVPHAFGDGFPTADVDAGQVSLWTGEFTTDATDVSVPGFTDDLTLSRTAATYAGAATTAGGVFGPGWTAGLDGPGAGLAGMQLLDGTRTDGTLTLVDGEGTVMVFAPHGTTQTTATRRTSATLTAGAWDAVDQETQLDGTTASVQVTGAGDSQDTIVTFTQADGTTTTFNAAVEPTSTTDAVFAPSSVDEPGTQGVTGYDYDPAGRVTRIYQAPPGITCPASALHAGCRVVRLDYTPDDIPTLPAGEARGQVRAVYMDIWNPDKAGGAGMDSTQVAIYTYDGSGRLTSVTDPRSNLTTGYSYDATSSRLATITPPGLKPYQMEYTGADHKLARVKRDRPATDATGGTATLDTILYNIPVTGSAALPSLTPSAVQVWGQAVAPAYAAAVFGPDKPIATLDPAQVSAADWPYAQLSYTDARGYTINTAEYGAGGWQLASTTYDDLGNVERELGEGELQAVSTNQLAATDAGTTTVYNSDRTDADGEVILPAGSVVTDTYGPARQAVVADGSLQWVRPHTHSDYDQGAPNGGVNPATGQAYALPTTQTITAEDAATRAVLETLSVQKTGYDPIVDGDASGWDLGQPTTTTTVMGDQPDIVSTTRYDADGRVIETRQPNSNGSDAGTRRTSYYAAAGTAAPDTCQGRPQWAGLLCGTDYAAAPTSGPTLPNTRVTGYSMLLMPTRQTETSGSVVRSTTTSYLADGRADTTGTTVTGLATSTPLPGSKYTYDPSTGLRATTQSITADGATTGTPVTTGYDTWGRTIRYSAAVDDSAVTTYDAAGRVSALTDNQGTTTWFYSTTDAAGRGDYRGLPTKATVSNPNGRAVEFAGAYDADGHLTLQSMPGGITQRIDYNTAGQTVALSYSGQVGTETDAPWLSWSQFSDALGRVRLEDTPAGAAFDGDLTDGGAQGYSRAYSYDRASRLTNVIDNIAPAGSGGVTASPQDTNLNPDGTSCQVRSYGFDRDGNRTSVTRRGPNPDGSCASSGGSTKTSHYDTADRLTDSYAYDPLGRMLGIPGIDTPAGVANGDLALGYYDDDSAHTITQNGVTTSYSLDALGRRAVSVTAPATGGTPTETTEQRYIDDGDNPSWTRTTTSSGTTVTRYAESLRGDLGVSIDGDGVVEVTLTNLHGDAVTDANVPAIGNACGIDYWANSDEYGVSQSDHDAGAPGIQYGWLGAEQRATDRNGLLLMGARLYNPITGQFTSSDPVPGGNSTAYAYPQDPVNTDDLTGMASVGGGLEIYHACRNAGGGKSACGQVVALSGAVSHFVAHRVHHRKWKQNALRHFVWQGVTTAFFGRKIARAIGAAHEKGSSDKLDTTVDLRNNRIARRYAGTRCWDLSRGFAPLMHTFFAAGVYSWENHRLWSGYRKYLHRS